MGAEPDKIIVKKVRENRRGYRAVLRQPALVFYGTNSWNYTRFGKVTDQSAEQMTDL